MKLLATPLVTSLVNNGNNKGAKLAPSDICSIISDEIFPFHDLFPVYEK